MENLIQSLQAAVAPCILISGLGLILLTMTNRLGRTIDRIRSFSVSLKHAPADEILLIKAQVDILYRRGRLLQTAIALVSVSMFFVASVMLMLFSSLAFNFQFIALIKIFFMLSLLCLIASLAFFFLDVRLTLASLKVEMEHMNK
ncbi:MAG: DUF2721 domain-containing protein [Candidatus Omnitrophica bacterium]|nr:DUF2721 domain-containing protein [Candidatus Omnitrophota bacterium]